MINGNIDITLKGTLKAGDRIVLWKVGSLQANNAVVNLPELPEGLYWDTSELLTNSGTLKVTDTPTGIRDIHIDGSGDDKIYTLGGVPMNGPLKKGIYIKNGKKVVVK